MARSDTRYREAYNRILAYCETLPPKAPIPSETSLAEIAGVSRTVIRRCLARMEELGLISWQGRDKHLLRAPLAEDRIAVPETPSDKNDLEQRFLDWVLRFDVPANTPLSVAELSRTFGVAQHDLKEFLAGLSRFGLVSRRPQGGWMLLGFTKDFAIELSDFRSVLELNAVTQVAEVPVDHPVWAALAQLRQDHLALKNAIDTDFHEFSKLDERFHLAINSVVRNRFIAEFQKVISLIFHYHYMWDKTEEKDRNAAAIDEHIAIIDALEARDAEAARLAAQRHLRTSKTTLLSSLRHHDLG
ncbi:MULTISPECIES: GntR family transcriptional regulator [Tritonibacter]|uniref:GntR family transcriptional regulator n=1 Tax=Tritonibacter scottomollicae TaxID=483013 RepID=A0A2T1AA23_TRISK|nr:GntR family transcriptional regulator [Tritonibacter scottomollicae]PRZ45431.1 GntR family transcriptional regulator [Tritonibacter scottomollicae]WOI33398.1 GntR family transcriptional regulator [Tritonibacter scottomollicae]